MDRDEKGQQMFPSETDFVEIILPERYLRRMLNWHDFCEGEGFSNELDKKILAFFDNIGIPPANEPPYQTDET